jgi:hypothetical protein
MPVLERHCPVSEVAYSLGFSVAWVKKHLDDFPGWFESDEGELRIPASSVIAWVASHRGVPGQRRMLQKPESLPTVSQLDPDSELAKKIMGRHKS